MTSETMTFRCHLAWTHRCIGPYWTISIRLNKLIDSIMHSLNYILFHPSNFFLFFFLFVSPTGRCCKPFSSFTAVQQIYSKHKQYHHHHKFPQFAKNRFETLNSIHELSSGRPNLGNKLIAIWHQRFIKFKSSDLCCIVFLFSLLLCVLKGK